MSHTRREVIAGVGAGLCLGASPRIFCASERPALQSDEGLVLCSWGSTSPGVRAIDFRQFHARPTFSISRANPGETPAPSTVKVGQYYLYACDSDFANVGKNVYPEPADARSTFAIVAGVVNYIGDWVVTRQGPRVSVHLATISDERQRYPWLASYQLFVSTPGREPIAVNWDQLH